MLQAIDGLPETRYDDSDHRDFFIAMGLGVLHHAIKVMRDPADAAESGELEAIVTHLLLCLRASHVFHSLLQSATEFVDSGLDIAAVRLGWPLNRLRRPPG